ncbi:MAG: hemolysin family protein [Bacteroidales bacterium]
MMPLLLFLLACAAVYFGTVAACFSALMRLSLRLLVERNGPGDRLGQYLEDPVRLLVAVRVWLALDVILVAVLLAGTIGTGAPHLLGLLIVVLVVFTVVFEHLVPALFAQRNPEATLDALLPSFSVFARVVEPITLAVVGLMGNRRRDRSAASAAAETSDEQAQISSEQAPEEGLSEGEERRLLQSIVDFGDTLVREVMTPRPDIVAIDADETLGALRSLLREQEYSRMPVYKDSLDNIVGFVFVKDLIILDDQNAGQPLGRIMRPAYFVPETKRVSDLLKEFQRHHMQIAMVVDEYGGTAGLVTIEDLLEEIVGEIRDEYDVESEPITDEGNGAFLVNGKVNIDDVADRLNTPIEREGFETVGGYLLSHLGRVPLVGETFDINGLSVEVLDAERRRVNKVRIRRRVPEPEGKEG